MILTVKKHLKSKKRVFYSVSHTVHSLCLYLLQLRIVIGFLEAGLHVQVIMFYMKNWS